MQSLLTVTSLAGSYDLTVLATAKAELGIAVSDTSQDARVALLIHQVSNAISTLCDRVFAEETVSEVFRLNSGSVGRFRSWARGEESIEALVLRRRPISWIVSVVEDGVTVDVGEYECDLGAGLLYRLTPNDFRMTWIANKVTINYVSGFTLLDDLPYDIEKACLIWIKSLWIQMRRSDLNIKVEDAPDLMRREYFDPLRGSIGLMKGYPPPPEVMILLSPYIEAAIR